MMGSAYAFLLPLEMRHPAHLTFIFIGLAVLLANLNHAGLPFGYNPMVSTNGARLGIVFPAFWLVHIYWCLSAP